MKKPPDSPFRRLVVAYSSNVMSPSGLLVFDEDRNTNNHSRREVKNE